MGLKFVRVIHIRQVRRVFDDDLSGRRNSLHHIIRGSLYVWVVMCAQDDENGYLEIAEAVKGGSRCSG